MVQGRRVAKRATCVCGHLDVVFITGFMLSFLFFKMLRENVTHLRASLALTSSPPCIWQDRAGESCSEAVSSNKPQRISLRALDMLHTATARRVGLALGRNCSARRQVTGGWVLLSNQLRALGERASHFSHLYIPCRA